MNKEEKNEIENEIEKNKKNDNNYNKNDNNNNNNDNNNNNNNDNNNNDVKLSVFSGHDTVIAPILAALGVYNGNLCVWPPYASRIVFELWQEDKKGLGSRLIEQQGQGEGEGEKEGQEKGQGEKVRYNRDKNIEIDSIKSGRVVSTTAFISTSTSTSSLLINSDLTNSSSNNMNDNDNNNSNNHINNINNDNNNNSNSNGSDTNEKDIMMSYVRVLYNGLDVTMNIPACRDNINILKKLDIEVNNNNDKHNNHNNNNHGNNNHDNKNHDKNHNHYIRQGFCPLTSIEKQLSSMIHPYLTFQEACKI